MKNLLLVLSQTAILYWLLAIVFFIFLMFIVKKTLMKINQTKAQKVLKQAEARTKRKLEKVETNRKLEEGERVNRVIELMCRWYEETTPIEIDNEDIILMAKLYNTKSEKLANKDYYFQIATYSLTQFLTISTVKNQLFYNHSISGVLKMFNTLFKKSVNDYHLNLYLKNINVLRDCVNRHRSFKGAFSLKKIIDRECANFPTYNWGENWNNEEIKIKG